MLTFFVSCRPTDWRPSYDWAIFCEKLPVNDSLSTFELTSEEEFLAPLRPSEKSKKETPPVEKFRCVILQTLDQAQVEIFAYAKGVANPKAFSAEINKSHAWLFARRPLDLERLILTWEKNGKLGSLHQQYEAAIEESLKDNPDRSNNMLSMERAIEGSERLALAMQLTKTRTIQVPEVPADYTTFSLDAVTILSDWSLDEIKALLRRSIFDPATYGRVQFHHRSIQEFLASRRLEKLHKKGMPKRELHRLIFADNYEMSVIIPSMRPVAAWLSKNIHSICREVLSREPEVLILYGDPEMLPLSVRIELIQCYVDAYGNGTWRGMYMPITEIQRLASPDLAPKIKQCWSQSPSNEEVRIFLLQLIWLGEIQDCAEIAFETTMNADFINNLRILGARALGGCRRYDLLRKIYGDIIEHPNRWSDHIIYSSADELFPHVISVEELKKLIQRIPEPKQSVSGFSWTLYILAQKLEPNSEAAILLRNLLRDLIWENRKKELERWKDPVSQYSYLTPALARLCQRRLSNTDSFDEDWIYASVIACYFHNKNTLGREDLTLLITILLSFHRETIFWFLINIRNITYPDSDVNHHLCYIQYYSVFRHFVNEDWDWLIHATHKKSLLLKRSVALQALIPLWSHRGKSNSELRVLKKTVKDNQDLTNMLVVRTRPNPLASPLKEGEEEHQAYIKTQAAKQQETDKLWLDWKAKAEADPAACFKGKRREETRWTLIRWLNSLDNSNTTLTYYNWKKIRRIFGDTFGELFEQDLRNYWRKTKPPVWSRRVPEKRGVIYPTQNAALTGLAIENASDTCWTSNLSQAHAKCAAEWGLTELNGFPEWYTLFVKTQPKATQKALITELKKELKDVSALPHPPTLNKVQHGNSELKKLVFPFLKTLLMKWPGFPKKQAKRNIYNQNLDRLLSILTAADSADINVLQLCEKRFLANPNHSSAAIWLRGVFYCNLTDGIEAFSKAIPKLSRANRKNQPIEWFGTIFGDYYRPDTQININNVNVNSLLLLTKLVYEHVRCEDDVQHEGIYTPNIRDKAEQARTRILGALIEKPGNETLDILITLANNPLFAHISDWLRLKARERSAKDSELSACSFADYKKWEEEYETPPRNCNELLKIALNRLEDIRHDIHHHDFSDRSLLESKDQEADMQPLLAKKFSDAARSQYSVSREEEVADKKKTDIRLTTNKYRCVIEIKIGDKWSVSELEAAIKNQLIDQYLRHETCTAGCLLVTYAGCKGFKDPDTGESMTFEQVIERLQKYAITQEKAENHRIKVIIFPLDLRCPINKKSQSQKSNKIAA